MDRIIDFHTHAFPGSLAPRALSSLHGRVRIPDTLPHTDGTVPGLIESMDSAGIDQSVICSIATAPKQFDSIMDWSISVASDRIIPFASLNPLAGDVERKVAGIRRSGLLGIKIHPHYQGYDLGDDSLGAFFAAVQRSGLILLVHSGLDFAFPKTDDRAHPRKIRDIHESFPDIPLIAAHMGGWQRWKTSLDVLAGTEIYFDTSFSVGFASDKLMLDIFGRHSRDRILFGSDSPWRDQGKDLEALRRLLEDDTEMLCKVCSRNALRLLSR